MKELYNQIAKYEKKKIRKTNIISAIMIILGIAGAYFAITENIKFLSFLSGVPTGLGIADLLLSNLSVHKTIKKLYISAPILKEGKINRIEDEIIIATDEAGMEYELTPATNHQFITGNKVFFMGVNEFLGVKCKYIRYPFYNGKLL